MKPGMALSVLAAVLILTGAPRGAAAQGTKQTVRFVPDVLGQFSALTQRADAMGFELYGPDPSQCDHMQAIVRVDAADGTPYFLVSRSTQDEGTNPLCEGGSTHSNIYVVKMGSRDKTGERLRSNRLMRGATRRRIPQTRWWTQSSSMDPPSGRITTTPVRCSLSATSLLSPSRPDSRDSRQRGFCSST